MDFPREKKLIFADNVDNAESTDNSDNTDNADHADNADNTDNLYKTDILGRLSQRKTGLSGNFSRIGGGGSPDSHYLMLITK